MKTLKEKIRYCECNKGTHRHPIRVVQVDNDIKEFIKEIIEEIDKNIKEIKYSQKIGNALKEQAGKNAFKDIEEKENFAIIVLNYLKNFVKEKGDLE